MTQDPSAARGNKRRYLRVPLRIEITRDGLATRFDYAINLSPGGLCLQTRSPAPLGTRVELGFQLFPHDKPVRANAEVVWCVREAERGPGMRFFEMGLRFLDLDPVDVEAIEEFVEQSSGPNDPRA